MTPAVAALAAVVGFSAVVGAVPAGPVLEPTRHVVGVLEEVDFIHRTGRFRNVQRDGLTDFVLLPFAAISVRNAEADLRDLPLGSAYHFTLQRDADGRFTRVVSLRDRFTVDARQGMTYRVDAVNPVAGTLQVSPQGGRDVPGGTVPKGLRATKQTHIRKGDKAIILADITVGDDVLVNLDGGEPVACTDIWVGPEARKRATDEQRRQYAAFVKARGLAGRVDRTAGKAITLSLFGDPNSFTTTWAKDFVVGRAVNVVVANEELRTWNPPVDHERAQVVEVSAGPAVEPGFSGVRLTVTVNHMLEGFRKGRVVRVFGTGWRLVDQPFGEQLFHYGARSFPPDLAENPAKEYPDQYPFRTDYGNARLPWYRLTPGVAPPPGSEHRVFGTLLAVGADHRSGRFRPEDTRDEREFTLIPGTKVRSLNGDADLADVPLGTRCQFHLYQDDTGAFRRVSFVTDEVSDLIHNGAAWRVESLNLADGTLIAARQPPGVKNDQGDPEQPPDIGRALLRVGPDTRVWKGDKPVALAALAVGDLLLVNRTGDRPSHLSRCMDIWIGADTHKLFTNPRPKKPAPPKPPDTGTQ
jgi:hypothetical protein